VRKSARGRPKPRMSYENPFRVKNDPVRNTLGIRSVARRCEDGGGRKELRGGNRKKFSRVFVRALNAPENDCSCETQKGSRGFSSQKGP